MSNLAKNDVFHVILAVFHHNAGDMVMEVSQFCKPFFSYFSRDTVTEIVCQFRKIFFTEK